MLFYVLLIAFVRILSSSGQRTGFCEMCNNTEECSDHRYTCRQPTESEYFACFIPNEDNSLRCFCDRFHNWGGKDTGCVQIFNASEIVNMTHINVTDNIKSLEAQVSAIIKAQMAAGIFVFGMVIVASVTIAIFCIYAHVNDSRNKATAACKSDIKVAKPSCSFSQV